MSPSPLISVVMPARNAAATIEAALASLRRQSETRWEAIVIDDRSTDQTAELVRRLAADDARIRLIEGPGINAAAARNRGIDAATGDWLHFLDADDWLAPNAFATLLAALAGAQDAEAAYCRSVRVYPDGAEEPREEGPELEGEAFQVFARRTNITIHSALVRRARVIEVGCFDPSLRTCEDWDLWQRLARLGIRWIFVDAALAYYRFGPNSLSAPSRALIDDVVRVIDTGFGPDPRVATPDPRYAGGASGYPDRALSTAFLALWWLTAGMVRGLAMEGPFDHLLAAFSRNRRDLFFLAQIVVDAVAINLALTRSALGAAWETHRPAIERGIALVPLVRADAAARRDLLDLLDLVLLPLAADDRRTDFFHGVAVPLDAALREGARLVPPYDFLALRHEDRWMFSLAPLGDCDAADVRAAYATEYGAAPMLRHLARTQPRWVSGVATRAVLGTIARDVLLLWQPRRLRREILSSLRDRATAAPRNAHSAHRARFAGLRAEALALAAAAAVPPPPPARAAREEPPRGRDRDAFWNQFFATEDPWNYGSAYEQEKYRHQLALLPEPPPAEALELACAEGHFTLHLAERVGRLTATDISEQALARARQRAGARANVRFARLDLSAQPIPGEQELIVCSEVLYYLDDLAELRAVTAKIAHALKPGGALITAHAFTLVDDRSRTGFDWDNPFGGEVIARTFAEVPGLVLEESIQTEVYRVDRFRRLAGDRPAAAPVVRQVPMEATLEPEVERLLIRGGAPVLRGEIWARERHDCVPVLMYHHVADDGPAELARYRVGRAQFAEQIHWLRANGYHTLTSAQLAWYLRAKQPFQGRPVMITFDDGMESVAREAWPVLRRHDFTPEVFIVTSMVGQNAAWDGDAGRTIPLMTAETIARLAREGVKFGSHFHRHVRASELTSEELARELLISHALLAAWTGAAPTAVALPFTSPSPRAAPLAREAGYQLLFGDRCGPVRLGDRLFDLPRIEVMGDWSLAHFTAALEAAR